jgi:hypothetical protein
MDYDSRPIKYVFDWINFLNYHEIIYVILFRGQNNIFSFIGLVWFSYK